MSDNPYASTHEYRTVVRFTAGDIDLEVSALLNARWKLHGEQKQIISNKVLTFIQVLVRETAPRTW